MMKRTVAFSICFWLLLCWVAMSQEPKPDPVADQYVTRFSNLERAISDAGTEWRIANIRNNTQYERQRIEATYKRGYIPGYVRAEGYRAQDSVTMAEQRFKDLRREIDALKTEVAQYYGSNPIPPNVQYHYEAVDKVYDDYQNKVNRGM